MSRPEIVRFVVALALACVLALATATHGAAPPDGFPKPRTVAAKGSYALETAVDSRGRVTLVWERWVQGPRWVQTRRIAASGKLRPVHTLSPPGGSAGPPRLALGPDGTATVVWQRQEGSHQSVQMTRVSSDGEPEPVTTLSQGPGDAVRPVVAVDAQGRAIVVWEGAGIEGVRIGRNGVPGPVQSISEPDRSSSMAEVAVDGQGRATVAWRTFESLETCVRCTSNFRIEAVRIDADGTAGPIQTLSPSAEYTSGPEEIGIDSAGTATVVWIGGNEPGRLLVTRVARDGTLGETRQLSRDDEDPLGTDLLIDSRDRATIAWGSDYDEAWIQARRIDADGTVGRLRKISPGGVHASSPSLASDARDRVTVGWTDHRSDGLTQARVARLRPELSAGPAQALTPWGQKAGLAEVVIGGSDTLTAFTALRPGGLACCYGFDSRIQMLRPSGGR